jgi:hypothetical protein
MPVLCAFFCLLYVLTRRLFAHGMADDYAHFQVPSTQLFASACLFDRLFCLFVCFVCLSVFLCSNTPHTHTRTHTHTQALTHTHQGRLAWRLRTNQRREKKK